LVFRAHQPHEQAETATWFGYWKDDGFLKTKHNGRVDLKHTWPAIRDNWLDGYRNSREVAGHSVLHRVTADMEWCAETYMETDYRGVFWIELCVSPRPATTAVWVSGPRHFLSACTRADWSSVHGAICPQ
jgi:hypothetical protein